MYKIPLAVIAKILVVLVPLVIAFEHFSTEVQPDSRYDGSAGIPGYDHILGPSLKEIPASVWARGSAEPVLAYVTRINRTVHYATYHCRPTDHTLSWVLGSVSAVAKSFGYDSRYELGLFGFGELKCGFCSERAAAVTKVLLGNGIDAITYGIGGHVVSKVEIGGVVYFADPVYGVGPYVADLSYDLIREKYKYSVLPSNASLVAKIVTETSDDAQYFSESYFETLRHLRRSLSYIASVVATLLVLLSSFLGFRFFSQRNSESKVL